VRVSYAEAYKAPVIDELTGAQSIFITTVVDTQNNDEVVMVPTTFGGNPRLSPETGTSKSAGVVWTSDSISNLLVSATYFDISENNRIVFPSSDVLIAHPNLFPGRVTRNGAGQIVAINQTFANFGSLDVQGVDLGLNYKLTTGIGDFSPGVALTVITRYVSSLVPGQPLIDRLSRATDEDSWAPRYKGVAALAWQRDLLRVTVDGRYVGSYLDYQTPPNRNRLGDTWYVDGSIRYDIGKDFLSSNEISNGVYVQISAVNVFDVQPKYSNFNNGIFGFDPSESDLLGRFVTLKLGVDF
jgi:iron complex outermembrane receptor protein